MATITKIFKPRRGLKSTMYSSKDSTVLSSGEMFVECQGSTVGKGKVKLKIGDGSTSYSSLDYALGDTSTDPISFTNNDSDSISAALNSVTSGNSLQTIIGGLKQTMSLNASSIDNLTNDTNNNVSSLDGRISANTNNISSLTNKTNSNSSNINNLISRLSTLESGGGHHWEPLGTLSTDHSITLTKNYSFILKIYYPHTIKDVISGSACKTGYTFKMNGDPDMEQFHVSYQLLGYV